MMRWVERSVIAQNWPKNRPNPLARWPHLCHNKQKPCKGARKMFLAMTSNIAIIMISMIIPDRAILRCAG